MANQPLFSICHTSARPEEWGKVYKSWLATAAHPENVEYVLVVDHDWGFTELPARDNGGEFTGMVPNHLGDPVLRPQDKVMWARGTRHCYVEGVNLAASHSTGKIIIVNADDQYAGQDWDEELTDVLLSNGWDVEEDGWDGNFIILPSTGTLDEHIRKIAVMPILSRARYLANGYALYPLYESMFADNDFLAHARKDGVVIEAKYLLFPHRHPFNDGVSPDKWDSAYKAQGRPQAFAIGQAIWEARQNNKFTEFQPISPEYAQTRQKPRLVMCLPGESYSQEWVTQWTEILCQLSTWFEIVPIFSWCTNVYTTRESLAKAAADAHPDYICWIDDDNLVAPGQIVTLINHLISNPTIDMVGGWCWLRSGMYIVVDLVSCGYFDGLKAKPYTYAQLMQGEHDLVSVDFTGFPLLVMRGDVLSRLPKFPFRPILSDEYPYGHSGEDVGFCHTANEYGLTLFVDRTVKVVHLKRKPDEPAQLPALPQPELVGVGRAGSD
jgi:hypothetical protein